MGIDRDMGTYVKMKMKMKMGWGTCSAQGVGWVYKGWGKVGIGVARVIAGCSCLVGGMALELTMEVREAYRTMDRKVTRGIGCPRSIRSIITPIIVLKTASRVQVTKQVTKKKMTPIVKMVLRIRMQTRTAAMCLERTEEHIPMKMTPCRSPCLFRSMPVVPG